MTNKPKTERRNWTRDELLVALKVYRELEFGQFHQHQPMIIEVSSHIERTPSSLAMKLCNFASLDPAMNGKGLKSASRLDQIVFDAFLKNSTKTIEESDTAFLAISK